MSASLFGLGACASPPSGDFDERREAVEERIEGDGLASDPRVQAARDQVEASVAREAGEVLVDEVELRTEIVSERDQKARLLARIPFEHWGRTQAQKKVARAESEVALAQLHQVGLEQRIRDCEPSLEWLVHTARSEVDRRHASRLQRLLEHNERLRDSGVADESRAIGFGLAGQIALARRVSALPPTLDHEVRPVLPSLAAELPALADSRASIGRLIERHHPSLSVRRARADRFRTLAERERASRWPTLSFVDFGVEPEAFPGDDRRFTGRASFEVPLGFEARARARSYAARAKSELNAERADLLERTRIAEDAIARLNRFRARVPMLLELLEDAERVERLADSWLEQGGARPDRIANLLDEVHDARNLVLDDREEAGRAACHLLEQTGVGVEDWPTQR